MGRNIERSCNTRSDQKPDENNIQNVPIQTIIFSDGKWFLYVYKLTFGDLTAISQFFNFWLNLSFFCRLTCPLTLIVLLHTHANDKQQCYSVCLLFVVHNLCVTVQKGVGQMIRQKNEKFMPKSKKLPIRGKGGRRPACYCIMIAPGYMIWGSWIIQWGHSLRAFAESWGYLSKLYWNCLFNSPLPNY